MDSFIFKGKSSKDFKIIINSLPTISKPPLRVEEIEIDGVDGARYEELGYGCYEKKIKITITEDNIDSLIDWLKGEGDLILSNEPDKYYNAKIIEQIDFERLMKYEPTEIKFRVQPFKYQYQEEKVIAKTGSVEGTEIKISDVKAIQMQIDGRSIQDGIPTPDTPVEIKSVGYENLLNLGDIEKKLYNLTTNIKQSEIIFNGTKTVNSNTIEMTSIGVYKAGTYTFSLAKKSGSCSSLSDEFTLWKGTEKEIVISLVNGTYNHSFTLTEDTELFYQYWVNSDSTYNNYTIGFQLTKGTKKHSYIPCGKYGIEIKTLGENLYDLNESITTQYNTNGTINSSRLYVLNNGVLSMSYTFAKDGRKFLKPILLKSGTYTLSFDITNSLNTVSCFSVMDMINLVDIKATTQISSNENHISHTFTLTKDANISFSIQPYNDDGSIVSIANLIINQGNERTYKPYQENISLIILNEPPRSLPNGIKDIVYIKNNRLYVDKYVGSVVLNGSEEWSKYDTYNSINQLATIITNLPKYYGTSLPNENTLICSHFDSIGYSSYWVKNNSVLFASQNKLFIQTKLSVEEFKSWLSNNNVQVDYELATPLTEEYGDFTILQLVDGENNISNSEDANMIIDYIETLNVDNLGNHTAKPIFEIEGVGKVNFILNNSNVFSYNFEDDGKVVIDSEKEDAYLGLTLKNRNMNGEFPIFNPGENKFTWDGLIKNISVSKKSRWL